MKTSIPFLKNFTCLGLIAVFIVSVTGCGNGPQKIRIGINAWPGYEFLHLALVKGFYKQEGLDVELVEFNSLSDAARSYELGQIDGLATTAVEVLMVRSNTNKDLKIIRVFDYSNGADMIVAPKAIATLQDLRGKAVGVELASVGTFVLGRALEIHNLNFSDIKIVSEDQVTMEERLKLGEIEAVVTYPPVAMRLVEDEKYHPIFTSSQIPGEVVDVLAVDGDLLKKNKKSFEGINRALDLAYDYFQSHKEESIGIMAAREGITPKQFAAALEEGIQLTTPQESKSYMAKGGKLESVVKLTAKYLENMGVIKAKPGLTGCLE